MQNPKIDFQSVCKSTPLQIFCARVYDSCIQGAPLTQSVQ